jgi:large subunit ribosomal protein L29
VPNKTATDFRTKTSDELETQLEELSKEQFNLRFQRANGQLENTARVRKIRRDIARTKLIISEKRSEAAK